MTAIVGLAHAGDIYIGGDAAGVAGHDLTIRDDSKVFRNDPFVFGFTSSFRMGQLLRYKFKPPTMTGVSDETWHMVSANTLHQYMATDFVDGIRDCLKAGGWATKDSDRERGGTFMVGVYGQLFVIHDDYQVSWPHAPFHAIGSGSDLALGVMWATNYAEKEIPPSGRIRLALSAAERYNAAVRGPFTVISSRDE